ncbi:MauE/DoxX family redox-associated membrane protein [Sediminibacterium salmoneum]|uniref:MauE/DoxX family redox-associated membrane protein n=1 Tax=Sediminibacterium salmoneum TaxID=426421 RepID=UPI0012F98EA6|nr:MauE/DoxX family redox-associated membrane protein [Sediminibacterium salmoneum]
MKNQWISLFSVNVLIFVLIYTASAKLLNFPYYVNSMRSQPLPSVLSLILTYLIPVLEGLLVYFLMARELRMVGLLGTGILLLLFTFYVGYIKISGLESTTCPCGGLFSSLDWDQHFYVNSALTVLAFFTYFYYKKW